MNRIKTLALASVALGAIVLAACGGGNNSASNKSPANNAPANNEAADNSTASGNNGDNTGDNGGTDIAAERDAVIAKAVKYLNDHYQVKEKSTDENKVGGGIHGAWGPNSGNIPYTAFVVHCLHGTKLWKPDDPKIKESVKFVLDNQEPNGEWSYAPIDKMPQAKGVRALYITSLVTMLLVDLNKEGPWKGKLDDNIAKARDYIKQSQVGNPASPLPDYDKNQAGYGGWAYSKQEIEDQIGKHGEPASNMSTTTFAIDALHACGVSKDDPVWKPALVFLKRNQNAGEVQEEGFQAMYDGKKVVPAKKDDPNYGGSIYSEQTSKPGAKENPDGTVTLRSYGSMTYNLLRDYMFAGLGRDSLPVKLAWGWIQRNYTVEKVPGYPEEEDFNRGLYYYLRAMATTLSAMDVKTVDEPGRDVKHDWRADLVKRLKGLQKEDGHWVNTNNEWQEDSPILCTCYALDTLNHTK